MLDPQHPAHDTGPFPFAGFYYGAIKETRVVDDSTVAMVLQQPFSPLLHNLTLNTGRMVSPTAVQKWGKDFAAHPVGTGPFRFVRWDRNVQVIVEKSPEYWGTAPDLDRLIFRPILSKSRRVSQNSSRAGST
jgi:peptide/nickel transport system substrate-binding protein